MKIFNLLLLAFLLVITVSTYKPLVAGEQKWHLTYETGGIKVYRRVTEGSKFFAFKAVGNLRGKTSDFVSIIFDIENLPNWVPRCLEARKIEVINDREFIVYSAYAGVWPAADRDYAAKLSITSDPEIPKVRADIERIDLPDSIPLDTDRVQIPFLKSYWTFEQISRDLTRVELCAHADPGGWIPAWLVNWGYRKIPYQFLINLESQVAKRLNRTSTIANISQ